MGDVVKIKNALEVTNDTDRDRFLMHHPVANPNKPGKVLRVLIGAKFHGASLNKSLLTGLNLLQNSNLRTHTVPTTSICRINRHQGHVLSRSSGIIRSTIFAFLWREDPASNVVAQQYTRPNLRAKDQLTCANYLFQRTVCDYVAPITSGKHLLP